MALSVSGSSTMTSWKRRSSALSFSKYFWYSSKVVAKTKIAVRHVPSGFEDVGGIHRALATAGTNERGFRL
jgi:hypothetical protein